jgi:WD40 repeat protein/CHAT domain-containing protein/tetratricopeptide (TPR) repeat protein
MTSNKSWQCNRSFLVVGLLWAGSVAVPVYAQSRPTVTAQTNSTSTPTTDNTPSTKAFGGQAAIFSGHQKKINSIKFSLDGQYILTASDDKTARLWDKLGNQLVVFQHNKNRVGNDYFEIGNAEFSPDGKLILTSGKYISSSLLWDNKGNFLFALEGNNSKFSADGNFILSKGREAVYLSDRKGKLLAKFKGSSEIVALSPDGSRIITKGTLWDQKGNLVASLFQEGAGSLKNAEFSPDSNFLLTTGHRDKAAHLWDRQGTLIANLYEYQDWGSSGFHSAKFSPDGRYILTVSKSRIAGTIRLWNTRGKPIALFEGHEKAINSAEFSPDGQYILTASDDKTARLWDRKGKLLATLRGHNESVESAKFSADGIHIITTSNDNTIRFWDKNGNAVSVFRKDDNFTGVEVSSDGSQILSRGGNIARLWKSSALISTQPQRSESIQTFESEVARQNSQSLRLDQPEGSVEKAIFSPDSSYIISMALNGKEPRLWNKQGKLLTTLGGQKRSIQNIGFSPNGNYIFTSSMEAIHLWDKKGTLMSILPTTANVNGNAKFSPDGRYILAQDSLNLWDTQGKALAKFDGHSPEFSSDSRYVLTAVGKAAYMWDINGKLIAQFPHDARVYSPKFSPDGNYIFTSGFDKTARLWDRQGKQIAEIKGHGGEVIRAKFSPDGLHILIFSYDPLVEPAGGVLYPIVDVWNLKNQTSTTIHLGRFTDAEFSPDSLYILTSSVDSSARLWNKGGNLITTYSHGSRVERAKFSPDGNRVITTSHDRTARLWQRDGKLLATFQGHEGYVTDGTFSPDGQKVVTVSRDRTARVWDVPSAILAQAKQMDSFQSSQVNVAENNNEKADTIVKEALELNKEESAESRQLALQNLKEAFELYRIDKNSTKSAKVLLYIGNIQFNIGEFQTALNSYNKGLSLSQSSGAIAETAAIFNSLGQLYRSLADLETARKFYNQALLLLYQLNDRAGAAVALNNLGDLEAISDRRQDALKLYNQALTLSQTSDNKPAEADSLMGLGSTYIFIEDWENALKGYSQALNISRSINDSIKGTTILKQMGKIQASSGKVDLAKQSYRQALTLSQKLSYRTEEADIFYHQATLSRRQNDLITAKADVESAIKIVENLRTKIASQDLRAAYFATVQGYYQFKIDLLMQLHQQNPSQGYDAQALETSDQSRARVLRDLLTEARANITRNISPELKKREDNLAEQLNAHEKQLIELSSKQSNNNAIDQLKSDIQKILQEQQSLKTEIRQSNPAYASLQYPSPITLTEIQQQLDSDTLLLQYQLGPDKSYLWVIGKTTLNTYTLPKQSDIATAIQTFRQSLQDKNSLDRGLRPASGKAIPDLATAASTLTKQILTPASAQLSKKHLVIVPDGALHTIPFAAIAQPNSPNYHPLLENHPISYLPSASTIAILRSTSPKLAPKILAVLADPVFSKDDDRLKVKTSAAKELDIVEKISRDRTARSFALNRLFGTRLEANSLLDLISKDSSTVAFDFDANDDWMTKTPLNQYRYIHLATHGFVDGDRPELSSIIFSAFNKQGTPRKAFFRLPELFNLNLSAQMVTLSACQTGLGTNQPGEGLVGMTRGLMYAGAERVTVSLWNVPDQETAQLMEQFYQNLWLNKSSHVESLRSAQLKMWQQGQGKHPYYWAAFGLQGEWRN